MWVKVCVPVPEGVDVTEAVGETVCEPEDDCDKETVWLAVEVCDSDCVDVCD